MQKLLLLFCACLVLNASAQVSYQHYLDSSVRWTYEFSSAASGANYYNFSAYTVQGDTLINGEWYWKIWVRTHSTFNGVPSDFYQPAFALRETPDKKFFQYNFQDQTETLMNDFNLELGDTLLNDVTGLYFVDQVDTLDFGPEKRLFYRSIYPVGVVEGIGFVRRGFYSWMHCFQKQQSLYPAGGAASCGFSAVEIPGSQWSLQFWPNPANTILNLELPQEMQNRRIRYRWQTVTGQLFQEGSLESSAALATLSLDGFPTGVYMLQVGEAGAWISGKVVVLR